MEDDLARYAPDSRQICVLGLDAKPLRNSLIRRDSSIPTLDLAILLPANKMSDVAIECRPRTPLITCRPFSLLLARALAR